MKSVQLFVPLGYTVEEETCRMPVEQARRLLLSKRQRQFTRAVRDEQTVTLTRHYVRCPHCSHRFAAYARQLGQLSGRRLLPDNRIERKVILDWTSQQLSFFEEQPKPLQLNRVVQATLDLTCPHCKNTMHRSNRTRLVEVSHHRHKVTIRAEVLDVAELFALPCLSGTVTVAFPLYEVACFNFRNGHAYIRLETPDGSCLAIHDLTSERHAWTTGAVHNAVTQSKYVRRALRDAFRQEWKSPLPFYPSELGVNELRMLTMFVGYDRTFYAAIPFAKHTFEVDDSFRLQARRMRHASRITTLYEQSGLPQMKSIRKVFFENAGLFFYLEECVELWNIFRNPNHFVAFLCKKQIYQVLSDLHMRPLMFTFIRDYVQEEHIRKFLHLADKYWPSVCRYAVNYASMSPHMQRGEQKNWHSHKKGSHIGGSPAFAIPMSRPNEQIRNCTIDGFEFVWLKTSTDYEEAGKALNNCLTEWSVRDSPVVCVCKNGKIVAAIEVRQNEVYQAYAAHNNSLESVPGLPEAYEKWQVKNRLTYQQVTVPLDLLVDDDLLLADDDLPF